MTKGNLVGSAAKEVWNARLKRSLIAIVPLVIFVMAWHYATTRVFVAPRIYPQPADVLMAAAAIVSGESAAVGTAYEHAAATGRRLVLASLLSVGLGTLVGIAMGRAKTVFDLLDSLLWVLLSIPSVVWAFVLVVVLGIRESVPVLALLGILLPVVAIQIAEGMKAFPPGLQELADSYKIFGTTRLRHVYVPYLVPFIISSARVSFALGIRIVVVAEVIGLNRGIGFEMSYWYSNLEVAPLVAWSLLLAIFGLFMDAAVFSPAERKATRWRGEGAGVRTIVQKGAA